MTIEEKKQIRKQNHFVCCYNKDMFSHKPSIGL